MIKLVKEPNYKQAILIRSDLLMSRGKACAQCAHAAVESAVKVLDIDRLFKKDVYKKWKRQGMKKVILKITSEKELTDYKNKAERIGIRTALVKDAGRTELPAGTKTAIAIGPDKEELIDRICGNLPTL